MKYQYKEAIKTTKPTRMKKLPKTGIWLPISIAAYLRGWETSLMVRWMYLNKEIEGIKLPVGPLLVNLNDIPLKSLKK